MVKTYKYNILSINESNIFFFKCEVKFASNTAYKYDLYMPCARLPISGQ